MIGHGLKWNKVFKVIQHMLLFYITNPIPARTWNWITEFNNQLLEHICEYEFNNCDHL